MPPSVLLARTGGFEVAVAAALAEVTLLSRRPVPIHPKRRGFTPSRRRSRVWDMLSLDGTCAKRLRRRARRSLPLHQGVNGESAEERRGSVPRRNVGVR